MKRISKEQLIEAYLAKHGDYYDYSRMDLENKTDGKIIIGCPIHGEFLQNHLDHRVAGCPECGKDKVRQALSKSFVVKSIDDIILLVEQQQIPIRILDGNVQNVSSKLTVECTKHHIVFTNTIYHLLRGQGCSLCRKEKISSKGRLGKETFIDRAEQIHGKKYDYSLVKYKTLTDTVDILCPNHGLFRQKPREHLAGSECQLCSSSAISKPSQQWLDDLGIDCREFQIYHNNGYYVVDGFCDKTNTVYEFYGDYWHGNPSIYNKNDINPSTGTTFGELYERTMIRENTLKNMGYNIHTVWESQVNEDITKNS